MINNASTTLLLFFFTKLTCSINAVPGLCAIAVSLIIETLVRVVGSSWVFALRGAQYLSLIACTRVLKSLAAMTVFKHSLQLILQSLFFVYIIFSKLTNSFFEMKVGGQ